MGHQSLIYGVIETFSVGTQRPEADERTQAALSALPDDDEWPFLVRSMFSATFNEHVSVAYLYRPIHFAASLKEVEGEWEEWLVKFERLLAKLDGITAVVHLETELVGTHTYHWSRANIGSWPPEWEFRGGPRAFKYRDWPTYG